MKGEWETTQNWYLNPYKIWIVEDLNYYTKARDNTKLKLNVYKTWFSATMKKQKEELRKKRDNL